MVKSKFCFLFFLAILFHAGSGNAQVSFKFPADLSVLKNGEIEIVLGNNVSKESKQATENVFKEFWKFNSYSFVSYDEYKQHELEAGHFYFVAIRLHHNTYTEKSIVPDPMDLVQKQDTTHTGGRIGWGGVMNLESDSLNNLTCFTLIKSGVALKPILNPTVMITTPGFHSETSLVDPLDLIIMQSFLDVAVEHSKELQNQLSADQAKLIGSVINENAGVLANEKLMLPVNVSYISSSRYSAVDVDENGNLDTTRGEYSSRTIKYKYHFPIGYNLLNEINYENCLALNHKSGEKTAVVILLESMASLRYAVVFDCDSGKIIYYSRISSNPLADFVPDLNDMIVQLNKPKKK